jgi:hypothetical protein
MKITNIIKRAIVIAPLLGVALNVSQVAHASFSIPYGSGTTTYSFVNVGNAAATVVANYYNPDGTSALQHSYNTVATGSRTDVTMGNADALLPSNWKGSVVLSSDQDIIAVADTMYTGKDTFEDPTAGQTQLGTESSTYDAFNAGATTLYAPQLIRNSTSNPTASRMTIQNTTANAITVYLNWYSPTGGWQAQTTAGVGGFGSRTFDTSQDTDVPAQFVSTPGNGNVSVVITSTAEIVGVVERTWNVANIAQNWSADYSLLTPAQADTVVFSPNVQRFGAPVPIFNNSGSFSVYSSMFVQNTEATNATVRVDFIARGASVPSDTITTTVGAFATWVYNPFNGTGPAGGQGDAHWTKLGNQFQGSAKITAVTGQKLVGISIIANPEGRQNTAGAFGLVTATDASASVYAARYSRICSDCTSGGSNTLTNYSEFANLQLINVDPVNAASVTIDFIPAGGGAATYSLTGISLAAGGGADAWNSRTHGYTAGKLLNNLGANFQGSVKVTATTGKLKGVVTLSHGNVGSDNYNAANR